MLDPVFKKSDFTLCDVPVPKGYPQSQTHAGIAIHNGKLFLTCSPYPLERVGRICGYWHAALKIVSNGRLGKYLDADSFENPLLYVGEYADCKIPNKFRLLFPSPLMDRPAPQLEVQSYNSDPDIFIEDDSIYILNRQYSRRKNNTGCIEQKTKIFLICGYIADCVTLNKPSILIESDKSLLSPCLIKYGELFIFASIESNSAIDGHTFDGVYINKSSDISGLKDASKLQKVRLDMTDLLPWHMSLFTYHDCLYAIVTCAEKSKSTGHIPLKQYLGSFSRDLTQLHIYERPLISLNSYRGSACVTSNGDFVLYSTTVYERFAHSKSIDGRDIVLATMNFTELLNKLSHEEE